MDLFKKIVKSYWQFKWRIVILFSLVLISQIPFSLGPLFLGEIGDEMAKSDRNLERALTLTGIFGAIILLGMFITYWRERYGIQKADWDIADKISKDTITHIKSLSVGQLINRHSGVTQSKITKGESALHALIGDFLYRVIPGLLMVFCVMTILLWKFTLVGLVTLFTTVLATFIVYLSAKYFAPKIKRFREIDRDKVDRRHSDTLRFMSFLKINKQEDRYHSTLEKNRGYRSSYGKSLFAGVFRHFFLFQSGMIVVRVLGTALCIYLIFEGQYEAGSFIAVSLYLQRINQVVTEIGFIIRGSLMRIEDIRVYFKIMDVKPNIIVPRHSKWIIDLVGDVKFNDVHFAYKGEDPKDEDDKEHVLHGINFDVEPGETVAFVGPSGAGKSTIFSLLVRAYDPDRGNIMVDGIDLKHLDINQYLGQVGFIEQDPILMPESLRENLLLSLTDERRESVTKEEVKETLEKVGLSDLIPRLNKKVGELGKKLSGGEKQRVAIARAILKQPRMLLIDEATSSVDTETERLVQNTLAEVSAGATTFIIAHRLSTVQHANRLFLLKGGNIVDSGSHDELLSRSDLYCRLVDDQMVKNSI
jgi:ATP-binding cassette subfamily B protein